MIDVREGEGREKERRRGKRQLVREMEKDRIIGARLRE